MLDFFHIKTLFQVVLICFLFCFVLFFWCFMRLLATHPDNAIPVKSWFSDPHDTALLELLPLLDALRFTSDVRSVLSRNLHLHSLW